MNIESIKIAVACFLGAFVGALVALQASPHLWWLGIIVGAVVGYLAYRPLRALQGFREACTSFLDVPPKEQPKIGLVVIIGYWMVSLTSGFYIALIIWLLGLHDDWWWTLIIAVSSIVALSYLVSTGGLGEDNIVNKALVRKWIIWCNPVTLPFTIVYQVVKVLFKLMIRTLRLVHSDIRLLCMTDSAIGALVGYYFHSAILGGIIGAIVGLLNYELVSKRWLKLAPQRA